MTDPNAYLILASSGLAGLGIVVTASLAGWRRWLAQRRAELVAGLLHAEHHDHAALHELRHLLRHGGPGRVLLGGSLVQELGEGAAVLQLQREAPNV